MLDALIVVAMLGVQSRAEQVRTQLFSLLSFSVLLTTSPMWIELVIAGDCCSSRQ